MPIFRKKAGPEFEAMQFDGSFESAKAIMAWMGSDLPYWSSNNTMTIPSFMDIEVRLSPGDYLAKKPVSAGGNKQNASTSLENGFVRIAAVTEYEAVT